MDILRQKMVKIRKPQKCWGCAREFPVGTVLEGWTCIYEGEIYNGHTCSVCAEYMNRYYDPCNEGYEYGEIKENDFEKWDEIKKEIEGK